MARPKLGESDSKRLQMVITEAELEAVDKWQHANRVASRSEAIRRLVQIGLSADREIVGAIKNSTHVLSRLTKVGFQAQDAAGNAEEGNRENVIQTLTSIADEIARIRIVQDDATDSLFDLLGEIGPMRNADKFDDLADAIKKIRDSRTDAELRRTLFQQTFGAPQGKDDE